MTPTCGLFIQVPRDDKLLISLLKNCRQKGLQALHVGTVVAWAHTGGFLPAVTYILSLCT